MAASTSRENTARTTAAGEIPVANGAGVRPVTCSSVPLVKLQLSGAAIGVPSWARIAVVSSAV